MISEHTILFWTMIGTAGTALFTLLLAGFAWLAWQAAQASLGEMERQTTATVRTAAQQAADQAWGRQMDALEKYLSAMFELLATEPLDATQFYIASLTGNKARGEGYQEHLEALDARTRRMRQVHSTGTIWRLQHQSDLESVHYLRRAEHMILDAFDEHGNKNGHPWRDALAAYIDNVQAWQVSEPNRQANARAIEIVTRETLLQDGVTSDKP